MICFVAVYQVLHVYNVICSKYEAHYYVTSVQCFFVLVTHGIRFSYMFVNKMYISLVILFLFFKEWFGLNLYHQNNNCVKLYCVLSLSVSDRTKVMMFVSDHINMDVFSCSMRDFF